VPDLALVSLTGTGSASYTISITRNVAGTTVTFVPASLSFVSGDQFGRVDSGIASPVAPIFYAIKDNEAFVIGEILNDPFFGILEPQSGAPFTASQLNATFVLGTSAPATPPVPDYSGVVTLANTTTTSGNVNGKQDLSASGGNNAGQAVAGTYSALNSATGSGTLVLTAPVFSGQFLVVSPEKIVMMSTTAGDVNPQIVFLGNCHTTCGED